MLKAFGISLVLNLSECAGTRRGEAMNKTMRLQCRVTPATPELHAHLETIDPDYRGKRLVAMAALYLSMTSATDEIKGKQDEVQHATTNLKEHNNSATTSRPVANWIRGANV